MQAPTIGNLRNPLGLLLVHCILAGSQGWQIKCKVVAMLHQILKPPTLVVVSQAASTIESSHCNNK